MKSDLQICESLSYYEIKDYFQAYLLSQINPKEYPSQYLLIRKKLVEWIIMISQKLSFKPETMHRTIYLFDYYISTNITNDCTVNLRDLKLIIIAFLSISIKLNELNANYIQYLGDSILNGTAQNCNEMYTYQDLAMKELSLPSLIDYNISSPTVYHFNMLFVQIALKEMNSLPLKDDFIAINTHLLNCFLLTDLSVTMSPVNAAIIVFNETFKKFQGNLKVYGIDQRRIMEKIQKLYQSDSQCDDDIDDIIDS